MNKVRCQGCNNYGAKDKMRPVGLGWVHPGCVEMLRSGRKIVPRHRPDTALKADIRFRDGNRCRCCQRPNNLHVHHVMYRSQGGTNSPTNLVTLCLGCHEMVHSNKRLYQPALLELLRRHYEGQFLLLPEVLQQCPTPNSSSETPDRS